MNKTTSTSEPSLLVDLGTASRMLGLKRSSVRRLVLKAALPAIKAGKGGKRLLFQVAEEYPVAAGPIADST
jgi:hypothetical protein